MNKIKLDPKVSLNIKWCEKVLDAGLFSDLNSNIDLANCDSLYNDCESVCDWYDDVVSGREFFSLNMIDDILSNSVEDFLLVILGAYNSPLSLQLLRKNYPQLDIIIEIDSKGMDKKKELYDTCFPEQSGMIKCITADINSAAVRELVRSMIKEYYNGKHCIILMEGMLQNMSEKKFKDILSCMKSESGNNTVIFDSLMPLNNVSEKFKDIEPNIVNLINQPDEPALLQTYTSERMNEILTEKGGRLLDNIDMYGLERKRFGKNIHFSSRSDSWQEYSAWNL
jgi:hypothetical protein